MAKITFDNKVDLIESNVANINKVTASDLNALKTAINKLYDVSGWANYSDTGNELSVTTAETKLTIDALGSTTNEDYLPLEIRSASPAQPLWDENEIKPVRVGDAYQIRVSLTITAKSAANRIDLKLDIGGASSPTNVIAERTIAVEKTPPFSTNVSFNIFSLATFLSNGGQIFLSVDAGSVTIEQRSIVIQRTHSEI